MYIHNYVCMVVCWTMCLMIVALQKHEIVPLIACVYTFYDSHKYAWFVYASGLQYMFIDVHWYSTIHHSTRGLLSTMPVKVVIMTL